MAEHGRPIDDGEEIERNAAANLALVQYLQHRAQTYRIGVVLGIIIGGVVCLTGFILSIGGLSGQVKWFITAPGFSSRLENATPGIIAFVAGIFLVWRYKPKIRDDLRLDGSAHGGLTLGHPPNAKGERSSRRTKGSQ
jgi:hypothetical protein